MALHFGTLAVLTHRPVNVQSSHLEHLQQHYSPARPSGLGYQCVQCGSTEHGALNVRTRTGKLWASRSYARDKVLMAGSDIGAVGVEIQDTTDPFLDNVMGMAAHDEEHVPDRTAAAALWARKQSLLKATGYGLTIDPAHIRLTTPCTGSITITRWDSPVMRAPRYVWWHEQLIDNYWCTIAVLPDRGVPPESVAHAIVDNRAFA